MLNIIPGGFCHYEAMLRQPVYDCASAIQQEWCCHRKLWEFAVVKEAFEVAGVIGPGRRGLAFGVGLDPLVAYFASKGCEIVASDYGQPWWPDWKQRLNDRGICPPEEFDRLVSCREVDMNWIPSDLTGFDFCWSCCSLDRLGSILLGRRFLHHQHKTLKTGAVFCHTGEYNLSSDWSTIDNAGTVVWTWWDVSQTVSTLRDEGCECRFDFRTGTHPLDLAVDASGEAHIRLMIQHVMSTSFAIVGRKGPNSDV
jgi:hypothetical protein